MTTEKRYECSHCGKSFDKPTKLGGHAVYCKYNPDSTVRKTPAFDKYQINPKKCKQCDAFITFDARNNIFCSNACSAIYNNLKRDVTVYASLSKTLKSKISEMIIFRNGKKYASYGEMVDGYYKIPSMCKNCNSVLSYDMRKRKTCSHSCKVEYLSSIQKNRISENPNLHPSVLCSKFKDKRSFPEIMLEDYLIGLGLRKDIDFIPQFGISKYVVDFYLPNPKIVLEVNGRFWHDLNSERERKRTQKLEQCGCTVYHFWADKLIRKEYHTEIENLIASVV